MKALIVEDNALTRLTIRALLEKTGHEVAGEAENGAEAVKVAAELRPDVVFLDIILPGKSGLEILSDLRAENPGLKVVIITAVVQKELDKQLSDKGVSAILHKPFSYEEFKEVIKQLA
ncbi:MAG: response regulator [Elusimicrobia bacterium]|nr:response regulator [Elusimicrobiota bacterium]